jgi:hypothetical protein
MRASSTATSVVAAAAVALLTLATLGVAGSVASGATHAVSSHHEQKSAHVAFETCPSATTILTVSLPHLTYSNKSVVTVHASITNTSGTACGQAPVGTGPASQLQITPCGELVMGIDNAQGQNVYPGSGGFGCPAQETVLVPAHTTLRAVTDWNQRASYDSTHLAPRGTYTLRMDGALPFTIRLTGTSTGPLPGPTPAPLPLPTTFNPCQVSNNLRCTTVPVTPIPPPGPCQRVYYLLATGAEPMCPEPLPAIHPLSPLPHTLPAQPGSSFQPQHVPGGAPSATP